MKEEIEKLALEKQKERILELEKENAKLKMEKEALCNRILSLQEGFGKEFDLQNKRIDKLKDELKKIRVAYIYAQVGNVIAGTDIDSLFEKMFGKKENVVIWHDLRENPDDLPDCSHGHTVFNQDLGYRKAKADCKAKILKVIKLWNAREETIHDVSFKDGVQFGYVKGKEESKCPKIGQMEFWEGDTSGIPKGWYICDGRELPKSMLSDKDVADLMDKYGGIPDMRPAKVIIYLGGKNEALA